MVRSFFNNKIHVLVNVVFVAIMIWLHHTGILSAYALVLSPLFVGLSFYVALRNPYLIAALFLGSLPLEIISIVPETSPVALHPYQILGVAAACGAVYGRARNHVCAVHMRWNMIDVLVGVLSFVSVIFLAWSHHISIALQQTIVLLSFVFLYGVIRIFVHTTKDIVSLLPVVLSSGVMVSAYAVIQNVIFYIGGRHMEAMPGRPNATFSEPDWLGMYLVFVCAICITYLYHNVYRKHASSFFDMGLFGVMIIVNMALILTAARSAWVGAASVFGAYFLVLLIRKNYKMCIRHMTWVGVSVGVALMVVLGFHLTSFSLSDRLGSTQTGHQEITVACDDGEGADKLFARQMIDNTAELAAYGCRHINLEDVNYENAQGNTVMTIYRNDPNVVIRKIIYRKAAVAIMERPVVGYGWGVSSTFLGKDERGTLLNASNVFLETAVSVGLIGAAVLVMIMVVSAVRALILFMRGHHSAVRVAALLCGLCVVALVVPQMFNAGLFLGFVWMCFGFFAILWENV